MDYVEKTKTQPYGGRSRSETLQLRKRRMIITAAFWSFLERPMDMLRPSGQITIALHLAESVHAAGALTYTVHRVRKLKRAREKERQGRERILGSLLQHSKTKTLEPQPNKHKPNQNISHHNHTDIYSRELTSFHLPLHSFLIAQSLIRGA